jgi:hypothetical protein
LPGPWPSKCDFFFQTVTPIFILLDRCRSHRFSDIFHQKKIRQHCIFEGFMWTKLPLTASVKFWMVLYIFKISKSWKLGIVYQKSYESPTPPFVTK